jgi:hypothetical protein
VLPASVREDEEAVEAHRRFIEECIAEEEEDLGRFEDDED